MAASLQAAADHQLEAVVRDLEFGTGAFEVVVGSEEIAIATVELPDGWAYLQGDDARRVVSEVWDNEPDSTVLCLLDPPAPEGRLRAPYGVVVTFDREGHIRAEDALVFDHDQLLRWMKKSTASANASRRAADRPEVALVGWALPPMFDIERRALYWAKELRFSDLDAPVVNYDVRLLGRRGCMTLQAVAKRDDLLVVDDGLRAILERTRFTAGHRYEDFDAAEDPIAVQGIGGLIAQQAQARSGRRTGDLVVLVVGCLVVALGGGVVLSRRAAARIETR